MIDEEMQMEDQTPVRNRAQEPASSVLKRISAIIGVYPSRNELIEITKERNWCVLNRNEKRLKKSVVARLEGMRDQLLPELETLEGITALRAVYRQLSRKERVTKVAAGPAPQTLPEVATISFYLNKR
jgi:hypothetical protein